MSYVSNFYTLSCKLVQLFSKIMYKSQIGLYAEVDMRLKVKGETKLQIREEFWEAGTL